MISFTVSYCPLIFYPSQNTNRCHATAENLPNIPLNAARSALQEAQTSSTYVPSRQEAIPPVAKLNLLALHWLALKQARDLLSPSGAIVSSMGGRVPIASMMHMVVTAGYTPSVLTYTWKIQSEPEEVIGGYKTFQEQGLGPVSLFTIHNKPSSFIQIIRSFSSIQPRYWKRFFRITLRLQQPINFRL